MGVADVKSRESLCYFAVQQKPVEEVVKTTKENYLSFKFKIPHF